jgi:hypothetical protein
VPPEDFYNVGALSAILFLEVHTASAYQCCGGEAGDGDQVKDTRLGLLLTLLELAVAPNSRRRLDLL